MLGRDTLLQRPAARAGDLDAAPGPAPETAPNRAEDKRWNAPDLLPWIATLGGQNSQYDGLASVRQFTLLQESLEKLKRMVLQDAVTEQEAGEGLRAILKILSMEVKDTLYQDFRNPLFKRLDTRRREVGAFNPDAEYDQMIIDGAYDYVITGNLGTVRYVSLTVNGTSETATSTIVGYMDDPDIRALGDENGDLAIWLTKEKPTQPGGWIQIPKHASSLVIRQYIADRSKETLATFAVAASGPAQPDVEVMSDDEIAARIRIVVNSLLVNSTWHRTLMPFAAGQPNQFFQRGGAVLGGNIANTENLYEMATYEIGNDEALVIDFQPPQTKFWNLTTATHWQESQHYLTEPVSLTCDKALKRSDGSVRFILADKDPGLPNWLKTFHHHRGFLIMRMVRVDKNPVPSITRVKVSELAQFK